MTAVTDPWTVSEHDETQPASAHAGAELDELAISQVAADGLRLRLRRGDRDEAVRRMHGRVDADLIAWRLYTTTRTVQRVASRLGLTEHHQPVRTSAR